MIKLFIKSDTSSWYKIEQKSIQNLIHEILNISIILFRFTTSRNKPYQDNTNGEKNFKPILLFGDFVFY